MRETEAQFEFLASNIRKYTFLPWLHFGGKNQKAFLTSSLVVLVGNENVNKDENAHRQTHSMNERFRVAFVHVLGLMIAKHYERGH